MSIGQAQDVIENYEIETDVSVEQALANFSELEADLKSVLSQKDLDELQSNESH